MSAVVAVDGNGSYLSVFWDGFGRPFSKFEKFSIMPEFFKLIQPFMAEFGSNMFNQIGSSAIQSMFSRGDFAYTKNLTDIRQQVKDMQNAGLNPALAYGQLSSPQAQSLGNYQSDYASQSLARKQAQLDTEKIETENANQDYLSALAFKTRMEGINREFLNTHQEDDWNVQYEGHQLENVHRNLLNTFQFVQNRISEIDWHAKPYILQGQLSKLVSETNKLIVEAGSINAKLPYEVANIAASTKAFLATVKLNATQMGVNNSMRSYYEQLRKNLITTREGQELTLSYEKWLSNNGTNWTRKRGKEFETALLNGLLNLIPNFNFGVGFYGLGGKTPSKSLNWTGYGAGRDNLGH